MSRGGGPPGRAAAHQPARARAAVGRGAGARRHGVAAPGDPPSGKRADGTHPAAARRATRARAGPRAAIRLSRQPRPVGDRDPAVLPPGGVVGVAAGARRTRALLRRSRRRRVRRRALLRDGAGRHGATPWHAAGFALAATGPAGALMGRIRRLVAPVQVEIFPRWMAGVIAVTVALGCGAHLASGTAATGDRGGTRPATLDSLIDRVEALRNAASRHEAVKTLGSRRDPRMVPPLLAIAQQDGDEEVQHEAVKALGKVRGGGGVGALLEIARTHPDPGVRRKAVKMVGEVATAEAALGVLERLAQRDPDVEVQQEAVEALGHLGTPQIIAPLARLARAQPNAEVRDEAVEQYARSAAPESALVLLVDRLANDSSSDVQM